MWRMGSRLGALAVVALLGACGPRGAAPSQAVLKPLPPLSVSGAPAILPLVERCAEAYRLAHPERQVRIEPSSSSSSALRRVEEGSLDLAAVGRPVLDSAADSPLVARVFARDAFVLATRAPAPLDALTSAQVQAIYDGQVADWQELGGAPRALSVLDRGADSAGRELVLLPWLDGQPVRGATRVVESPEAMLQALGATPGAIGYSTLALVRGQDELQPLALDGVAPSARTIADGSYPWTLTFSLVHRKDAPMGAQQFADFAVSPDGRRCVAAAGFATAR